MQVFNFKLFDYDIALSKNKVKNETIIHKFGRHSAVGATFVPICLNGIYRTPQVSGATTLRIKAGGNANDTALGSGAREITLIGLDQTGAEITETLATNGASASLLTTNTFLRLFRAYVSATGTYTDFVSNFSHDGNITIENGAGGTDWAIISVTNIARSQTEIGFYTVPLGKTAYIRSLTISVDSTKSADILFFQRENILDTSAPYKASRAVIELGGISGEEMFPIKAPMTFPELTDIGFMGKIIATTVEIDVDYEILLVDN